MEKIQRIDEFLLDQIFQRIADWVWDKLPISCFDLAKFCLFAHFCIMSIVSTLSIGWTLTFNIFGFVINFPSIFMAEKLTRNNCMNPLRQLWMMRCIVIFIFLPVFIFPPYYWGNLFVILFPSSIYFSACQKRHPKERKILSKVKGIFNEKKSSYSMGRI